MPPTSTLPSPAMATPPHRGFRKSAWPYQKAGLVRGVPFPCGTLKITHPTTKKTMLPNLLYIPAPA